MSLVGMLIVVLIAIILILFWILHQKNKIANNQTQFDMAIQHKVEAQELNLQKTLEIMRDLAKKMHVQQEALDHTEKRINKIEAQNADLLALVSQLVHLKDQGG